MKHGGCAKEMVSISITVILGCAFQMIKVMQAFLVIIWRSKGGKGIS